MFSAVLSTSAALGRFFVFDEEAVVERPLSDIHKKPAGMEESANVHAVQSTIRNQQSTIDRTSNRKSLIANSVIPASQLAIRPAPEMASSGIPAIDALTGGLPRGCLTEICGPASSGRTTVLLAALAAATRRGEFCAVVDASDALDPHSVKAANVNLERLLWVRCGEDSQRKEISPQRHPSTPLRASFGTEKTVPRKSIRKGCPILALSSVEGSRASFAREVGISARADIENDRSSSRRKSEHRIEQALRAIDLLLESGGFGLIVLDLADLPALAARRIPLTTWFRFRRAVEHKSTILLALEQQAIAGSCSSLLLQLGAPGTQPQVPGLPSHAHLLTELEIRAEQIRSRLERTLDRKPAQSVMFTAKTAWAG